MTNAKAFQNNGQTWSNAVLYISDLAKRAGAQDEKYVLNAIEVVRMFSYDFTLVQKTVREVEQRLMLPIINKELRRKNPAAHVSKGDIEIGELADGKGSFMLDIDRLSEGFLAVGRPRSGKSNLIKEMALELKQKEGDRIRLLFIDFKNEYKDLCSHQIFKNILVLDAEELNPELFDDCPHNRKYQWAQVVINLLRREGDFTILSAHRRRLLKHVSRMIQEKGSCDFFELIHELEAIVGNKFLPKEDRGMLGIPLEILVSVAEQLCLSPKGHIPLETFLKRDVVLRLHLLSQDLQTFLSDFILYWIYCRKDYTRNKLPFVVVCDEAKRLFGKEKEERAGSVPYLRIIFGQARFLNMDFIMADQYPSLLASYTSDIHTFVCFNQTGSEEVNHAAKNLGLSEEEKKDLPNLTTGEAFAKVPYFPHPFKIRVRKAPDFKEIDEDELKTLMGPEIEKLRVNNEPGTKTQEVSKGDECAGEAAVRTDGVLRDFGDFLNGLLENPDLNVSEFYERLGFSGRKGTSVKKQLLEEGMIEEEIIHTGERKRPQKKLKVTQKGIDYLNGRKDSSSG